MAFVVAALMVHYFDSEYLFSGHCSPIFVPALPKRVID